MLLKNELRFLFSKRNILVLILVLISVLSVYFLNTILNMNNMHPIKSCIIMKR